MSMWYVYILRCVDKTLYTGTSTDVIRRVKEHNSKKGGAYTKARLPVKVVYKEPHPTQSQALKREHHIKGWARVKKWKLIENKL